ncbi:Levanase [Pedobacter sp. Bi27]|uniref:glycoside hydrolase family 32 protein n=1 Tax=unclassified Pedobacter TaxID=2628915 RepID=UPI001D9DBEA3|nr:MULTISPECIES: glycoside hydrolase family 32 protein [unclassified Pedobacter]CAH0149004.1 Levanase [Pedobacter sp. Bi126]CAH0149519.1 Levanase [Pedobacter sp. Bi27]CAH0209240.1 Levanase [Pedobacter sp. Bi36]
MKNKSIRSIFFLLFCLFSVGSKAQSTGGEKYRPAFHFSPKAHWMNDPNGMVYYNGVYHLFFQYHPGGTTWGPMHWGHATTQDFFNWEEKPIALYPDSLGTIFSGSIVIDKDNTAGFGKNAMVAIFTHHNQKIEEAKTGLHQYQSIAYSNDEGKTWTKYKGNPVLPNPGISDFRDPKVMWYEQGKKWIMTLATKDRITFYSAPDLKAWKRESDFGANLGAHGGVWECPDLFPLKSNGKTVWVLLVSINPGGPNGGSATQYFTGNFDGNKFVPNSTKEKWVDYGTDNYAGVTWSNTGDRKIFLGWMNNWQYANQVPTKAWRGATTIARDLSLASVDGDYYLRSLPVKEISPSLKPVYKKGPVIIDKEIDLSAYAKALDGKFKLDLSLENTSDFNIILSNVKGQKLIIGYDKKNNSYFIDRTLSGETSFEKGFAKKHSAPRLLADKKINISLILDVASIELFADNGLTVMTDIFFPDSAIKTIKIQSKAVRKLSSLSLSKIDEKQLK